MSPGEGGGMSPEKGRGASPHRRRAWGWLALPLAIVLMAGLAGGPIGSVPVSRPLEAARAASVFLSAGKTKPVLAAEEGGGDDDGSHEAPRTAGAATTSAPAPPTPRPPAAGLMEAHGQGRPRAPSESPVPTEPALPRALLLVSAHTKGWITPCGCAGSQAGGVARRAGYGQLLRKTFPGVPVYYFDLGGFLSYGSKVQNATSAAVIDAMNRIGYEAMNTAYEDLGMSLEEAVFLETKMKVPRVSANIVFHDTGSLAFPPYRIVNASPTRPGGRPLRIGILGLVDEQRPLFAFGPQGRSLIISPMGPALARYVPELRSKADLVILLAETSPSRLWDLAEPMKGIDMVVAGTGTDFLLDPTEIGGVRVVAIGNQGKYLAELRVHETEGKPVIAPFVHWLDERFPEDEDLAKITDGNIDRINELSRRDLAEDDSPPPEIAPFVGGDTCVSCHEKAAEVWKGSKHARAFQTLVKLKRDYTVSCVYCHVTGMGVDRGGFASANATPQLLNVQCEQCHGPAEAHLKDPSAPYGDVPEGLCLGCHSPATDPHFEYETRWRVIAH